MWGSRSIQLSSSTGRILGACGRWRFERSVGFVGVAGLDLRKGSWFVSKHATPGSPFRVSVDCVDDESSEIDCVTFEALEFVGWLGNRFKSVVCCCWLMYWLGAFEGEGTREVDCNSQERFFWWSLAEAIAVLCSDFMDNARLVNVDGVGEGKHPQTFILPYRS